MPLHDPILDEPSIRWDCRHYRGDRPCAQNRLCDGCEHYAAHTARIAIIKLGALGDVIRTLCILPELRRQHPQAQITWITQPAARAMIQHHPDIDRLLSFEPAVCMQLVQEKFDLVICLDKEPEPCALAGAMQAPRKLGMGLSPVGTPVPFNRAAVDYFHLGLSDELKFEHNRKGYPQLVYEALGWRYDGQRYALPLHEAAAERAERRLIDAGWRADGPTLGVNVGAGSVFANKMWPADRTAQLLEALRAARPEVQVLLLGGQAERTTMERIHAALPWTIHAGCDHDAQTFIALIDRCDALFCGDTLAMHLAIARRRHVVVFFGPTCEQEIELFGRGEKLIAHTPCSPCYKRQCDQADRCLDAVSIGSAVDAILNMLQRARTVKVGDVQREPMALPVLRVA